jgi:2-oxoglutarate ferredoxin oxidoreductase subunit alpha
MHTREESSLKSVVVRFAGDSGDGIQLVGEHFTTISALLGNDLSTLPDFPAEIRAPAGTLAGVSSFQVQIAPFDIATAGDVPDVLVAMNPASLRANVHLMSDGGVIVVNADAFDERSVTKAGYTSNPLIDNSLLAYEVIEVPMTSLMTAMGRDIGVSSRDAARSKNFFALGLISWLYSRSLEVAIQATSRLFATNAPVAEMNQRALRAGYDFGETTELIHFRQEVPPAPFLKGEYAKVTGNTALAWGLLAAARRAEIPLFLGSYPITPASDILHELAKRKDFNVLTFQAEDEIASIGAAIGAAIGGSLGVTTTSGPGLDLKSESIGLAVSLEIPLVIVDVQRAGPSTGLPTKVEQADLLQAMYGRHGEAPLPVIAAATPSDCFYAAYEAARIAITYRTPVIILSDANLANSSEPWLLPSIENLLEINPNFAVGPNHVSAGEERTFWPYKRDVTTLARPWAPPGRAGLEHRIGGLEKADGHGAISYDGANHERMSRLRSDKVAGMATSIPEVTVDDVDGDNRILVLGWGSTYGAIVSAVAMCRSEGHPVAHAHLRFLNPFPQNLGSLLRRYRRVLVPELNLGQLSRMVRAEYLVDVQSLSKMQGSPFTAREVASAIIAELKDIG